MQLSVLEIYASRRRLSYRTSSPHCVVGSHTSRSYSRLPGAYTGFGGSGGAIASARLRRRPLSLRDNPVPAYHRASWHLVSLLYQKGRDSRIFQAPATADRLRRRHRLSARANGSAHVGVVPLQPFAKAEP